MRLSKNQGLPARDGPGRRHPKQAGPAAPRTKLRDRVRRDSPLDRHDGDGACRPTMRPANLQEIDFPRFPQIPRPATARSVDTRDKGGRSGDRPDKPEHATFSPDGALAAPAHSVRALGLPSPRLAAARLSSPPRRVQSLRPKHGIDFHLDGAAVAGGIGFELDSTPNAERETM